MFTSIPKKSSRKEPESKPTISDESSSESEEETPAVKKATTKPVRQSKPPKEPKLSKSGKRIGRPPRKRPEEEAEKEEEEKVETKPAKKTQPPKKQKKAAVEKEKEESEESESEEEMTFVSKTAKTKAVPAPATTAKKTKSAEVSPSKKADAAARKAAEEAAEKEAAAKAEIVAAREAAIKQAAANKAKSAAPVGRFSKPTVPISKMDLDTDEFFAKGISPRSSSNEQNAMPAPTIRKREVSDPEANAPQKIARPSYWSGESVNSASSSTAMVSSSQSQQKPVERSATHRLSVETKHIASYDDLTATSQHRPTSKSGESQYHPADVRRQTTPVAAHPGSGFQRAENVHDRNAPSSRDRSTRDRDWDRVRDDDYDRYRSSSSDHHHYYGWDDGREFYPPTSRDRDDSRDRGRTRTTDWDRDSSGRRDRERDRDLDRHASRDSRDRGRASSRDRGGDRPRDRSRSRDREFARGRERDGSRDGSKQQRAQPGAQDKGWDDQSSSKDRDRKAAVDTRFVDKSALCHYCRTLVKRSSCVFQGHKDGYPLNSSGSEAGSPSSSKSQSEAKPIAKTGGGSSKDVDPFGRSISLKEQSVPAVEPVVVAPAPAPAVPKPASFWSMGRDENVQVVVKPISISDPLPPKPFAPVTAGSTPRSIPSVLAPVVPASVIASSKPSTEDKAVPGSTWKGSFCNYCRSLAKSPLCKNFRHIDGCYYQPYLTVVDPVSSFGLCSHCVGTRKKDTCPFQEHVNGYQISDSAAKARGSSAPGGSPTLTAASKVRTGRFLSNDAAMANTDASDGLPEHGEAESKDDGAGTLGRMVMGDEMTERQHYFNSKGKRSAVEASVSVVEAKGDAATGNNNRLDVVPLGQREKDPKIALAQRSNNHLGIFAERMLKAAISDAHRSNGHAVDTAPAPSALRRRSSPTKKEVQWPDVSSQSIKLKEVFEFDPQEP